MGYKESDITEETQKQQQEHGKINLLVSLVIFFFCDSFIDGFSGGSDGKASAYNVGDPALTPGLGRYSGEGNGNPLQYYCLENPMDRGAWQATVYGVTKSRTQLSNFTFIEI